jgi:hypothetical protein
MILALAVDYGVVVYTKVEHMVFQALSCFISLVLVHQSWRLEFSSVTPKKDCFMIISTNRRGSSWPDVRLRSKVSSGQSFHFGVQLKIDKSGTKWPHKDSNKWEDRKKIKSKLKYGTRLVILKCSLLTVSPRQHHQKCLLIFVKPTETLWWIICKHTDTSEHFTLEEGFKYRIHGEKGRKSGLSKRLIPENLSRT